MSKIKIATVKVIHYSAVLMFPLFQALKGKAYNKSVELEDP